jgi:hypothetical protein
MSKPRATYSFRLSLSTIRDLEELAKKKGFENRTQSLRFLLRIGFSSLGNWRKETKTSKSSYYVPF